MIAFVGGRVAYSSGSSVAIPAIAGQQVGDILLLSTWEPIGAPAGWASISGVGSDYQFWKLVGAGDGGGWTVGASLAAVAAYRGQASAPFLPSAYIPANHGGPVNASSASEGASPDTPPGNLVVHTWLVKRLAVTAGALTVTPSGTPRLRAVDTNGATDINDLLATSSGFQPQETCAVSGTSPSIRWNWVVLVPTRSQAGMMV